MVAGVAASAVVGVVLGAAVLGLTQRAASRVPSVRAHALGGAVASALVLAVVGVADATGEAAMREAQRTLEDTTAKALRDTPGWNGGATLGNAAIVASTLDRRSQASKVITHPFDRPFRAMLLTVDNRAGDHDLVVDLDRVRVSVGGAMKPSVPRAELRLHCTKGDCSQVGVGSVRVPAGSRLERAAVFFGEEVNFKDVDSAEVQVDGAAVSLQGRYFTVAEKKAIDADRAR